MKYGKNYLTPEEKSAKQDEELAEFFISEIEKGTAPWMKPWKANEHLYAHNPVTKTVYSGINSLHLDFVRTHKLHSEDPRWLTYVNCTQNGYNVKEGSKGTPVIWKGRVFYDKNNKIIDFEKTPDAEVKFSKNIIKAHVVFNGSQIEGIPPYEKEEIDFKKYNALAEDTLKNTQAKIFHDQADRNFYVPATDEIHLCKKEYFDPQEKYYSVAFHELSHWTGHESRLNREKGGRFGSAKYAREELCAEIGAYLLCKELHLDFSPQNTISYIDSWSKNAMNPKESILYGCTEAEKIRNVVMNPEVLRTMEKKHEHTLSGVKGKSL